MCKAKTSHFSWCWGGFCVISPSRQWPPIVSRHVTGRRDQAESLWLLCWVPLNSTAFLWCHTPCSSPRPTSQRCSSPRICHSVTAPAPLPRTKILVENDFILIQNVPGTFCHFNDKLLNLNITQTNVTGLCWWMETGLRRSWRRVTSHQPLDSGHHHTHISRWTMRHVRLGDLSQVWYLHLHIMYIFRSTLISSELVACIKELSSIRIFIAQNFR